MSNLVVAQAKKLANTFGVEGNEGDLVNTLKATAFRGQVSDAQMIALLVVAGQYGLNPFTKEIYAFPDTNNGIVPVVGVDGWSRIINSHQQFDGMEFEQDEESCTCTIYRKDRSHPTKVTEYMSECKRPNVKPWQSHPKRMLRHKATIQCARLAFGFVGIYDPDEAERIEESAIKTMGKAEVIIEKYPNDKFEKNFPAWAEKIQAGTNTAERIIAMVSAKAELTEDQKKKLMAVKKAENKPIYNQSQFDADLSVWALQVQDGKTPADILASVEANYTLTEDQRIAINFL